MITEETTAGDGRRRRGRAQCRAARVPRIARVRRIRRVLGDDSGAATAEYAMVVLGAVGLAGLLVVILRGDQVKAMLTDLISRALTAG